MTIVTRQNLSTPLSDSYDLEKQSIATSSNFPNRITLPITSHNSTRKTTNYLQYKNCSTAQL